MFEGYKREESTSSRLTPGAYRCSIESAEAKISKTSGKDMIVVTLAINGSSVKIKDFIVQGNYFNQRMTSLFDAFPQIGDGNFELPSWTGAMGAVMLKQDGDYLKVHYYLKPDQAKDLPAWQGKKPEKVDIVKMETPDPDDDLPF